MSSERVAAWDAPTRVFKWLLAATFVAAWATNRYAVDHPEWHKWNGYVALVLVSFRLLWGFFGGSSARFSTFLVGPRTVFRHAWAELHGRERRFLGHNPLGGWMIVLLLVAVGAQAVLGLFSAGGDYLTGIEGPLAHLVSDSSVTGATRLHRLGFDVILCLVAVHVTANVFYDLHRRAGLIRGIVTGSKPRANYVDATEAVAGSTWAAAACLVAAILSVSAILWTFS